MSFEEVFLSLEDDDEASEDSLDVDLLSPSPPELLDEDTFFFVLESVE